METPMKKQLFTALLTFAVIPSFTVQKQNKVESLAHLKQAKTELENLLQDISIEENSIKKEEEYYTLIMNIWNDIADLPEYSRRRKVLANFYFDQICNHKKSIGEIAEMREAIQTGLLVDAFL